MRVRSKLSCIALLAAGPAVLSAAPSFAQSPQAPPPANSPPPAQPGYYPQAQYPTAQPGYPQGQPGYPAAQPGYPAAQPGYPAAQPGYYPPAQPGYYPPPAQPGYPPAAYGYPPAAYPPPPAAEPEAPRGPRFRRGFLTMPYLGLNIPIGKSGDSAGPGFRIGTLLGGHVIPELSLNGEIALDVMNIKNVPNGVSDTAVMVDVVFSPLFHVQLDQLEFVVGPRLGAAIMAESASSGSQSASASATGLGYGLNIGIAIPVGSLAVGGMMTYTGRHFTEYCITPSGGSEQCGDVTGDDFKEVTLTGLLMF